VGAKQQAGGERGGAGSDKARRKRCVGGEYGVRASEGAAVTTTWAGCRILVSTEQSVYMYSLLLESSLETRRGGEEGVTEGFWGMNARCFLGEADRNSTQDLGVASLLSGKFC